MTADSESPARGTQHASFTLEKRIAAPPARVFAAWSDPAARERWFVKEEGWRATDYRQDFRPGGRERGSFQRAAGEPVYANETWFMEIVPQRRIVFAYTMDADEHRISASLSTVELLPEGEGTRLVYTEQAAFLDGRDKPDFRRQGWEGLLDRLEAEVAAH